MLKQHTQLLNLQSLVELDMRISEKLGKDSKENTITSVRPIELAANAVNDSLPAGSLYFEP
jgi:hypothetical protein